MKTRWMYWAVCFMCLAGAVGAAEAPDASGGAPVIVRHGAVTQAVEARWRRDGEGLWLTVTGLAYAEVAAIAQQGHDLTGGLAAALNRAEASVERRADGFTLRWNRPPDDLRLDDNATLELATPQGTVVAVAAESIACPVLTSFGRATAPALAADTACGYNSVKCKNSGQRHAGIDYAGNGDALAIASGTVVRVEALNANDPGLGNSVIVRHVLPGPHCSVIYSSYSRLSQISVAVGDTVAKGQKLGILGRSGYGNPGFWPAAHLHLELKAAPVTGNPLGAGRQNQTCATNPLNAQADSCWAYVGKAALAAPTPMSSAISIQPCT